MAVKKSGLGRNLSALLSPVATQSTTEKKATTTTVQQPNAAKNANAGDALRHIPLDLIQRSPFQPRREFDQAALQELAESIQQQGVIQPIVVRSQTNGKYELIAGERRWRAAQLAGLATIPVVVHDVNDKTALALAIIENIQREDLNPIEEADALQRLHKEFALTQEEVAKIVGKSRAMVGHLLRLLSLDVEVKTCLVKKQIEMGHARALLTLAPLKQREIAKKIITLQLSVRDTEKLVQKINQGLITKEPAKVTLDPNIRTLQETLIEKLGAKVVFNHTQRGNGKLTIHYKNLDQLQGILAQVGVTE